jgi:hypothetical protein
VARRGQFRVALDTLPAPPPHQIPLTPPASPAGAGNGYPVLAVADVAGIRNQAMARATKHRDGPHARIYRSWGRVAAWCRLPPLARLLLVEMSKEATPSENGNLAWSVRRAANVLWCGKDTASEMLVLLEKVGWISPIINGSFEMNKPSTYKVNTAWCEAKGEPPTFRPDEWIADDRILPPRPRVPQKGHAVPTKGHGGPSRRTRRSLSKDTEAISRSRTSSTEPTEAVQVAELLPDVLNMLRRRTKARDTADT